MLEQLVTSITVIKIQIQNNLPILGLILLFPWVFYFMSCISKKILLLGIIPRHLIGLPGIIFAPLLHANFNHIFFNSIPLIVLSAFILINGLQYYLVVTLLITLLSGLAIWCFAKNGLHVGASGLITGYWGFLVSNVYQHITPISLILAALSVYYFAGIFLGVFPREKGVSWQGHLFGLLAGIAASYIVQLYPQFLN
jgi:membrane associated rhomboid family serine protease